MNLPAAALAILVGVVVLCTPAKPRDLSFKERWEPIEWAPPVPSLTEQDLLDHVKRRDAPPVQENRVIEPRIIPVRTFSIRYEPAVHVEPDPEHKEDKGPLDKARPDDVARVPLPRARAKVIKRASLDICQRHGMRRVDYGRTWRCRK